MLAHVGNQKAGWPNEIFKKKSAFIKRRTVASYLKDVDMFIIQSISIPVENHIFICMDVRTGTGGNMGRVPPTFHRFGQNIHFHVAWLPSLKALKMQKQLAKDTFPEISEKKAQMSLHACSRWKPESRLA